MINKYQQGGKLQDAIMKFVQGIAQVLQADPNQVIQIAQQNPEALEAAIQIFLQTLDINQAAQTFQKALEQKTRAARHGAKLQYIKSLKHQCADDEELYYYKSGGKAGCGCKKKKMEDGGKTPKKKTAVQRFRERDIKAADDYNKGEGYVQGPVIPDKQKPVKKQIVTRQRDIEAANDYEKGYSHVEKNKGIKKNLDGAKLKLKCPKCGKIHAAGMGCSVAKFKYRKLGGLL